MLPICIEMSGVSDEWRLYNLLPFELHTFTSPWPFLVWGIDIIGKISPKFSNGHEYILVAIDYSPSLWKMLPMLDEQWPGWPNSSNHTLSANMGSLMS